MNSDEIKNKSQQIPPQNSDDTIKSSSENYSIPDHWHDQKPTQTEPKTELNLPLEVEATTIVDLEEQPDEIEQSLEDIFSPNIDELDQNQDAEQLSLEITQLQQQKQTLESEIKALQEQKNQILLQQAAEIQDRLGQIIKEALKELEQRKQALEISVEQLERRRERIREEMRTTFAGVSQELAIRVQGFKEYLVGSLQDLSAAAEQLELPSFETWEKPQRERKPEPPPPPPEPYQPQYAPQGFQGQARRIRELLDQYRTRPDYYGPPWQLRRTFELVRRE